MEENQKAAMPNDNPSLPSSPFENANSESTTPRGDSSLSWSAVEFIEHKKTFSWYLIFFVVLVVVSASVYFIVHSIFPVVLIVLIGFTFVFIASRSPKILNYELTDTGIRVGERFNSYDEFKSFSVIEEKKLGSATFNPFKRFAFPTTIYYEKEDEEKVLSLLMNYLPHEEITNDPIEQLMRKLHF